MIPHRSRRALALLALLGAAACTARPASGTGADTVITGTVTHRERIALPPDAEVELWVTDVSPGMVMQALVAQATVKTAGRQVPIPFELPLDPARVDSSHDYALHAVIKDASGTLFSLATPVRVITKGNPVRVELTLARQSGTPGGAPGEATSLPGTAWRLTEIEGRPALADAEATLEFPEPGRAGGRGSCNRWFGSVTLSGNSIRLREIGATKMACLQEGAMQQETAYFAALERAERWEVQGSTLVVHVQGAPTPLRFTRIAR